jgi:3-oxoacyl-[acyl-carrier-protein] synthase II
MQTRQVMITGVGVVSPLGGAAETLAARVCAGESAVARLGEWGVPDALVARVEEIPLEHLPAATLPRMGRLDRLCRLLLSAAGRAIDAASLDMRAVDAERVGLSVGTGLGCLLTNAEFNRRIVEAGPTAASPQLFAYTVSSAAAGEVSIAFGIKGAAITTHAGLAAGLQAIGYGADLIRAGKADVVLAGGVDALGPALVGGLHDMRLLRTRRAAPFRNVEPGVEAAEAAAVLMLEDGEHARHRGARAAVGVLGYALGFEPTLTHREPEPTGIATTMSRACAQAGCQPANIGVVITSAHGTRLDAVEAQALASVCDTPVLLLAPKWAWGECFAASGALGTVLASGLCRAVPPLADDVGFRLTGGRVKPAGERAAQEGCDVAMVHALCYSGTSVALLVGREESCR